MVSPIPTSSHRYRGQALGMAPKLIQDSSVLFCDVTGLPVRYKSQNRKQALISSPPAKANIRPFLPVPGCLHPRRLAGEGGALPQLLWPRPRGNALELASGLAGRTSRRGRRPPWALGPGGPDPRGMLHLKPEPPSLQGLARAGGPERKRKERSSS